MSDKQKPNPAQPSFLPRTWKAEPEPSEEVPVVKPSKKVKGKEVPAAVEPTKPVKKKKKKSAEADGGGESKGSKLEETPLLDTFEARQRVRYAVGGVLTLIAVISIIVLVKVFQPTPVKVETNSENKEARIAIDAKESAEREAAALVGNARQADKLGNGPAAVDLLRRVSRNYEGTAAAKEALAALDRERRNRPLFEVDATKNPTGPTPPALPPTGPTPPLPTGPSPPANVVSNANPAGNTSPVKPPEIIARALPNGFRAEPATSLHATRWPMRIVCDRDGASMVFIPGAEFLMGRDDGDSAERPSHRVKVSAFYIDEHEVTSRQYQLYLKETGRPTDTVKSEAFESSEPTTTDRLDFPATGVTASEAQSYCYWSNRRLPTEAQWELAARSSDGRVGYGFVKETSKSETTTNRPMKPVMANPVDRSPFGAFDFAGNAWEWTGDFYDSKYYYSLRGLTTDPTGPTQSRIKPSEVTVKGGSKQGYLTWRQGLRVEAKYPYLGFRGLLQAEIPAPAVPVAQPGQPGVNPPNAGAVPF